LLNAALLAARMPIGFQLRCACVKVRLGSHGPIKVPPPASWGMRPNGPAKLCLCGTSPENSFLVDGGDYGGTMVLTSNDGKGSCNVKVTETILKKVGRELQGVAMSPSASRPNNIRTVAPLGRMRSGDDVESQGPYPRHVGHVLE
jgi:hypothetical protein